MEARWLLAEGCDGWFLGRAQAWGPCTWHTPTQACTRPVNEDSLPSPCASQTAVLSAGRAGAGVALAGRGAQPSRVLCFTQAARGWRAGL